MAGVHDSAETGQCVVHVDVDAFYAQCEEIRNPALRERPLGITQKYLLVTSNYPARRCGVTKLMGITEAQQKCPDLVLVSGEDLTPYRQASKRILAVLQRFGICERGGMDEMLVDVTAEAHNRALQGSVPAQWAAHVHSNKVALVQDNKHRPMDLRALALRGNITAVTAAGPEPPIQEVWQPSGQAWEPLLMAGCVIAQEMRAALKAEVGFRCSAGISSNRMLAKLVSGLHKPDDQTVLLPPDASAFVAPLPIRALPGVGYKMGNELTHMDIKTAADLRRISQEKLTQKFGERIGTFLYLACRGQDPSPVQDKGPPKSITVEDSFKDCSSLHAAEHVIKVLAPDLLARMVEDYQETERHASTLTLKWRHRGSGWGRSSASCPMPTPLLTPQLTNSSQVSLLGTTLMNLLKRNISEPFQLTLLSVGVTNFAGAKGASAGGKAGWNPAFAKLLGPQTKKHKLDSPVAAFLPLNGSQDSKSAALKSLNQRRNYGAQPAAACISKSIERALREEGRGHPPACMPSDQLDALDWQQEEEDWLHGAEEEGAWGVHGNTFKAAASSAFHQVNSHAPQQTSSLLGSQSPEAGQQQQDPHLNVVNCQQQPAQFSYAHHCHHQHQQQQQPQQRQQQPQQRQQQRQQQVAGDLHAQQLGDQQQQWQQQQIQQPSLFTSSAADEQPAQQSQQQVSAVLPLELQTASAVMVHQHHRSPDELKTSLMQQSRKVASEMEASSCQSVPEGNGRQVAGQALHQLQPQLSQAEAPVTAPVMDDAKLLPAEGTGSSNCWQDGNMKPRLGGHIKHSQFAGTQLQSLGLSCTDAGQDSELYAHQSELGQVQMSKQIIGMQAQSFAKDEHQLGECAGSGNSDALKDAGLQVANTEQSDFKLAMRLQEQEHALQRQHSRPVLAGFLRAKRKPRQASGTLHAFFKKA